MECLQDWKNITNAALRLNYERKLPVRVVRGPKLQSVFGTRNCGGGYRYDGLYKVHAAEMVRLGTSRHWTAMFELRKVRAKFEPTGEGAALRGTLHG
jgi:hypothetical protein